MKRKRGMKIRPLEDRERPWARELVTRHFGSSRVVTRGVLYETDDLPGLIAMAEHEPVGLLHYRIENRECEVVVLIAAQRRRGVGTALLHTVHRLAEREKCGRVWLVTTNANMEGQKFYLAAGMRQSAVYPDALAASRKMKPEIPLLDEHGRSITDEMEYEWLL